MTKFLKRLFVNIAAILAVPILLIGLWLFPDLESDAERRFNSRLNDALRNSQQIVPLTQLTDFPWTRACYANSYTGLRDTERDAGYTFKLSDSIRWWLYAPDTENHGSLIFLTPNGIVPIKLEWTREQFFQIRDKRYGAKDSCDHSDQTKIFITNCTRREEKWASKNWCELTLI